MTTKKSPISRQIFNCINCNYECCKKSDYEKHLSTRKHKNTTNGEKIQQKSRQNLECNCGKVYTHRASLYNHRRSCEAITPHRVEKYSEPDIIKTMKNEIDKLTNLVIEVSQSNISLHSQMADLYKNSNLHSSGDVINSNNKTFNLNFFLNEQCKDAMNISEFVNTLHIELSDLEDIGNLGYIEGITRLFVNRLKEIDIYKRPLHCSDAKRDIIYVKDENKWEREYDDNVTLRNAIKTVSFKNVQLVSEWSDAHPDSKSSDSSMNDRYMNLIKETTGGNGDTCENESRIIKKIAKEITIGKI